MSDQFFTVKYDYSRPLNILEFADSLRSINELHDEKGNDFELQIKEVRKGSIELDLLSIDPSILAGMTHMIPEVAQKTHDFIKNIAGIINLLKDGIFKKEDGREITKKEAEAIHGLLAPTAKDPGGNFSITTGDHCDVSVTYIEAGVTQNNASKWINHLESRDKDIVRGVFLEWTRLNNKSEKGNRAIIESLWHNAVPTRFAKQTQYDEMIRMVDKPFDHYWDVDVHVERLALTGRPMRYTIISVNEELTEKN